MVKNKGINTAQNNVFDQSAGAVGGRTNADTFGFGDVAAPVFNPANSTMWFGTGNPITNYNLTDNGNLELGLKIINRGGADYLPTGTGSNGEQDYAIAAGLDPSNSSRAEWNFNYVVNTVAGVAAGDTVSLVNNPTLAAYDFKMEIVQSGPQFLTPRTAIFDLNSSTHQWVDENHPTVGFGGDDFLPSNLAPSDVRTHIAENSENVAFLLADFGPTLAAATQAGTQYDFKMTGFKGGTGDLKVFLHDHVTLVAPV